MISDDILHAITALGLGSGFGAIVTSVIAARSNKGKARAEAADVLIGAAERVGKMNESLDDENHKLKAALDASDRKLRAVMDASMHLVLQYADGRITKDAMLTALRKIHEKGRSD